MNDNNCRYCGKTLNSNSDYTRCMSCGHVGCVTQISPRATGCGASSDSSGGDKCVKCLSLIHI